MRKKYIVGNWKMFKTSKTAQQDFSKLLALLSEHQNLTCDVGISPPSVFLSQLSKLKCETNFNLDLYSQNVHWENDGAFTGEISIPMLKSIQIDGSLVAHSERRQYFNEINQTAGKKINALLHNNMKVIYCVGETLQERESGQVYQIIETQLKQAFAECDEKSIISLQGHNFQIPLSIAYEPVWAIGTGKAATVHDAHDVHAFIRKQLNNIFNVTTANSIRILYGGSVKPANIKEFISDAEIDGALVGGASLDPQSFFELCSLSSQ